MTHHGHSHLSVRRTPLQRTQRFYDETRSPLKQLNHLLPHIVQKMEGMASSQIEELLSDWPVVIGPQMAKLSRAVSYSHKEGVLVVKVANSTLHSLLAAREKQRLIMLLKQRHPRLCLNNIQFQLG